MTAAVSLSCGAAEWRIDPSVDGRLSFHDNIALTPDTTDELWGYQVAPRALFTWKEALTTIEAQARAGVNRYPGRGELNTDDLRALFGLATANERNTYGLDSAIERDSTLDSEARTTGVVQVRRQRTQKNIGPSYQRGLTERAAINLRYQYNDVDYEAASGLRNYHVHQASTALTWRHSERLRTDTSLSWDSLRTDDRGVLSRSVSARQGLNFRVSEQLGLDLSVGWRKSRTTVNSLVCPLGGVQQLCVLSNVAPVAVSSTVRGSGLILAGEADYASETGRYNLSLSRGTGPTGNGLTVRTDRVGLRWNDAWSERISVGLAGAWLKSAYDGNLAAGSQYISAEASTDWKLDERWSAGARYSYVRSRIEGAARAARSNTVYFTLSYHWPPLSLK